MQSTSRRFEETGHLDKCHHFDIYSQLIPADVWFACHQTRLMQPNFPYIDVTTAISANDVSVSQVRNSACEVDLAVISTAMQS